MRPQRPERAVALQHAEQVLQAPGHTVVGPQRVALEVEEQVTGIGLGQCAERFGVKHLDLRFAGLPFGYLQPRLRLQRRQRALGHALDRPNVGGEIGDRVDPGLDECGALGQPHVGNQHQIVVLTDVRLAGRAAQACPNLVVVPARGRAAGQVAVQQLLQRGPLLSVHRDQVVDRIVDNRPVAQDEPRGRRHGHTHGAQRVGVSGDLQQRRDLCAPGQFGVQHPVRDAVCDHEVGETHEPAVEQSGLVHHRRLALERLRGGTGGGLKRRQRVGGPADADHTVAVALDELLEGAQFVRVTQLGRAPQQFVVVGLDRGAATELGIERAQQGVFAPRGGREVRCAVDDLIVGDEHVGNCR